MLISDLLKLRVVTLPTGIGKLTIGLKAFSQWQRMTRSKELGPMKKLTGVITFKLRDRLLEWMKS